MDAHHIEEAVKEKYGRAAKAATDGEAAACCSSSCCASGDPITSHLYSDAETESLRRKPCRPRSGAATRPRWSTWRRRDVVLDLGSGGGIDVLLSARRVGPTGKAYGLDMTDEMLALARENQRKAGATNVEFLRATIEAIPLPDNSVDVIISNCVINLAADKDRVLREAFRVLKPGGRFAVSDVVVMARCPTDMRREHGAVGGLHRRRAGRYASTRRSSRAAGFDEIGIEPWRIYNPDDAREFLMNAGVDVERDRRRPTGKFASAFIRARKPAA